MGFIVLCSNFPNLHKKISYSVSNTKHFEQTTTSGTRFGLTSKSYKRLKNPEWFYIGVLFGWLVGCCKPNHKSMPKSSRQ